MPSAPPEQRQRALAGQATLLRARVLDPLAACWTALVASDDAAWREPANVARRLRQDLQIAFERYAARAGAEPPRLDDGEALAELARSVAQLGDATNATIDALAGGPAATRACASELDPLVVQLHRWFADVDRLDASWRTPMPAPMPAPVPAPMPASAPETTREGGEPRELTDEREAPACWPGFVEPVERVRAWWSPAGARASSPWSRHGSRGSTS